MKNPSVTPQHTLHQITQRSPEIFPTRQSVLIDKYNVVLEARVEMWLEAQVDHNGVMVTVDVGVHSVQPLEHLAD